MKYISCSPLELTNGDFGHKFIVQIMDGDKAPIDYTPYQNISLLAVLTAKGDNSVVYTICPCYPIDLQVAQFYFSFAKGSLDWNKVNETGTPPGKYDLSFTVDPYGDGNTEVECVNGIALVNISGKFL